MSTAPTLTPPSFRVAFGTQLEDQPLGVQQAHKTQWNAITDIYQSIGALNTKVEGVKSTAASNASAIENISTNSETVIQTVANVVGSVNSQTGVTSYATAPSDYGAFILLGDASPIAVTLSTLGSGAGIVLPWYCYMLNEGSGLVTVTPASGTISFPGNLSAASMTIPQNFGAVISFDGTNFWAILFPVSPQNTPAVVHQFLTAYNSTTGSFSQAAPTISDVTGLSAALALLAPIANPTFTGVVTQPTPSVLTAATTATSATAGAASALPVAPAGYLDVSINSTVYKLPFFNL